MPPARAAGTCSLRVGGPGWAVPGGPVPARLPRVPGRPGPSPGESVGARALGSPFRGEGNGVLRVPQGSPRQAASPTSEPANALGTPARVSAGCLRPVGSRRGRLSLVRKLVSWAPPDALVRTRAGSWAGPARPAGRPSWARDQPSAPFATNAQDVQFKPGICAIEKRSPTVKASDCK